MNRASYNKSVKFGTHGRNDNEITTNGVAVSILFSRRATGKPSRPASAGVLAAEAARTPGTLQGRGFLRAKRPDGERCSNVRKRKEESLSWKSTCPDAIAKLWIRQDTGSTWLRKERQTDSQDPFIEMRNGEGGNLECTATERAAKTLSSTGSPTSLDRTARFTTGTGPPQTNRRDACLGPRRGSGSC